MKIFQYLMLVLTIVIAFNTARAQYQLQSSVFGSGNSSSGGTYILHGSAFQTNTGTAGGGSYLMNVGFWNTYYSYTFVPPTVTTSAVSGIGGSSATGNGNITNSGGSPVTVRGICWNTSGSPTISDSNSQETGSFSSGAYSENMTGMNIETLYHVRAYATNVAGISYGNEVTFTTIPMPMWALGLMALGLVGSGVFVIYRKIFI